MEYLRLPKLEFKQATKDLIKLQDEQRRLVGVDLDDVVDTRMLQQFETTYRVKINNMTAVALEAFHNNIKWKIATTLGSAILAIGIALVGLS